jgi:phenylacetate-CoA ligase
MASWPGLRDPARELRRRAATELAQVESLSRAQLAAWQLGRLNDQLRYALAASPYYRREWSGHHRRELTDLAELATLPFTTVDAVQAGYPLGMVAVGRSEILRYGESTDGDGPPLVGVASAEDSARASVAMERALGRYFGADDLVFVAVPYELSTGAHDVDHALSGLGAGVVAVGALSPVCPPDRAARMMAALRPTGLVGTPSRAVRTFNLLTERGDDPAAVGLRKLLFIGDVCSPARAAKVATAWGAVAVWCTGSPLTQAVGLPCAEGALHVAEERYYAEVVDPASGAAAPAGHAGELVLTTLRSTALPLLRYRTGDLVSLDEARCRCGGPHRTLRHHGRVDDRLRLGERWLAGLELEQVVLSTPGTGLYCAVGVSDGRLTARVEVTTPGACADVADALRAATGVPCVVHPADRRLFLRAQDRVGRRSVRLQDLEAAS